MANDLISRNALLAEYDRVHIGPPGGARKLMEDAPAAREWIPVSERLPEPMEWVLCACRAKIIEVLRYDHIMDDWDTTMPNRCYMKGFVTPWMPLPETPKEDKC